MADASLDVIIVNWNGGDQLRSCLESLAATDRTGVEVRRTVVIDNASSDGSAEWIRTQRPFIHLVHNSVNRGFAAACNQGAIDSAADYLLFLNPDTRLHPNAIVEPVRFCELLENRQVGIVGIQLVDESGNVLPTCARFPTAGRFLAASIALDRVLPSIFQPHFMIEWDHGESRPVDQVMGAVFLVRRSVFAQLGGFDERFFVYFEEVDFSLRARNDGWLTYYLSTARAFHRGGGATEQVRSTRLFYSLRSRLLYARKHFARLPTLFLTLATLLVEPFSRLILALLRRSPVQFKDTLLGYGRLWSAVLAGLQPVSKRAVE